MSRELVRRAIVYDDLLGMAGYIARDDPAAAIRFLDAAEETFRFLSESPDVGNACELVHPELADMWYWHVRGFRKHLIF
jgi:plasmid stabilization system protein ParE